MIARYSKFKKPNTYNFYSGISPIGDKQPIKAVATGFSKPSLNSKTGDCLQVFFYNADGYFWDHIKDGSDSSVCGGCPFRYDPETGQRLCYVNFNSMNVPFKVSKKSSTPEFDWNKVKQSLPNKPIRLGAYGDPVLLPIELIKKLAGNGNTILGYTHQWRDDRFSEHMQYLMASCDCLDDVIEAKAKGYSTYRVLNYCEVPQPYEILCQGGYKTQCNLCQLCNGNHKRQRHIVTYAI